MATYKNTNGVFLIRELFIEYATKPEYALYTLQDEDITRNGKNYKSLYRLYMEASDPTEYTFAIENFHGWRHWKALSNSSFFKPYVTSWREELEIKIRSTALASILEASQKPGRDGFQAAKYVTDRGYDSPRQTKGRPTKEDISKAAAAAAESKKQEDEDYNRVLLSQDGSLLN